MDLCGICGQQTVARQLRSTPKKSANTVITCSSGRSCEGTTVHAGCANLTGPVLEALTGGKLGLRWECEQCRSTTEGSQHGSGTIPKLAQRMVATVNANLTDRDKGWKGAALPAEIWERIFEGMTVEQLLKVRLTCRRWRDVVDGSCRLRDQLVIKFPDGVLVDWSYKPKHLGDFATNVSFKKARLFYVRSWWSQIGGGLTELTLKHCKCLHVKLLEMLRKTPNLKVLTWENVLMDTYVGDATDYDFQLECMETFNYESIIDTHILAVFRQIFPYLKRLVLIYERPFRDFAPYVHMIDLVESVQSSLEELELSCTENVLNKLLEFEKLKLTKLVLHGQVMKDTSIAVTFCRKMPMLKDLEFEFGFAMKESDLQEIGKILSHLSRFATRFSEQRRVKPTFLAHMSNLRHLTLVGNYELSDIQTINFAGFGCPNLTHLKLEDLELARDNSLQQLLANSPNVTNLVLKSVHLASWRVLFLAFAELNKLKHLQLGSVRSPKSEASNWQKFTKTLETLQCLQLDAITFGEPALLNLLEICPAQLNRLVLLRVKDVAEGALRLISRKFNQLDELQLLVDCILRPDEERNMYFRFRSVRVLRIVDKVQFC